MHRRAVLAIVASLVATSALAAELKVGTTVEVKANSMWFEEAAQLTRWQQVRRRGDGKALTAYEEKVRGAREAWQFGGRLSVRILAYDRSRHQVKVEMLTAGRLQGSTWYVDDSAF